MQNFCINSKQEAGFSLSISLSLSLSLSEFFFYLFSHFFPLSLPLPLSIYVHNYTSLPLLPHSSDLSHSTTHNDLPMHSIDFNNIHRYSTRVDFLLTQLGVHFLGGQIGRIWGRDQKIIEKVRCSVTNVWEVVESIDAIANARRMSGKAKLCSVVWCGVVWCMLWYY